MEENQSLTQNLLLADIKQALKEEQQELAAEEKVMERFLVKVELPLLLVAGLAILLMQWMKLQGAEACPLIPNMIIAVLRMRT